ncbi:adenosylcobinamide-GDP ribazoletransferase [Bradyrhizobium oligotrophicum S58]
MSLREFWIALQFLTRLPTPRVPESRPDDLARASVWFPAAGLVIGVCLALVARLFHEADPWIVALAVLVAWILDHRRAASRWARRCRRRVRRLAWQA